ncbi:MAG: hypothetical protein ACREVX_04570 [Clostridium sp.]|uniref:hypothetical protein n=1 Tax=Clostridium sp. TaxID=1506 RepID=UPI003D6D0277
MNTSLRIKILSGILCTGLAFSGANLTFAATQNSASINDNAVTSVDFKGSAIEKEQAQVRHAQMKATLELVIKEGVDSNAITKSEGDKVLEYANAKKHKKSTQENKCKKGDCDRSKGGLFNDLVTEGILTQEKSDVLRKNMYAKKTQMRTMELKKGLNDLVVKKVITIEQSNKVENAMNARQVERAEIYKKMKDMSDGERKAYMKKMRDTNISPIKALIDNGTITKEQDIEIQKILPHHNHAYHGHK